MIEFKGYINGNAEQFFWNNSRKLGMKAFLFAYVVLLVFVLVVSFNTGFWLLTIAYVITCVATVPLFFIPKTKKERLRLLPNRIFTEDEYIVNIGNCVEEQRLIEEASKLIDYGDFYFVLFQFGNYSERFVCQKDLLAQGTLEEFEALFEGKIERRIKGNTNSK